MSNSIGNSNGVMEPEQKGETSQTSIKKIKTRHSVRQLELMYESGNKKPLEDLMRAWKGIKELEAGDTKSFFNLGGYHGEPFVAPGDYYPKFWGGFCNHGNVLFPTWHRVYVLKLEEALQSIVPDVTMPYWDETSDESLKHGIPWSLTDEKFELDGESIDNPLRSFVFPVDVQDNVKGDDKIYAKPAGYETVRYPLSGLVGTPEARAITKKHNAKFPDYKQNQKYLNSNVRAWLHGDYVTVENPHPATNGIFWQYINCLKAPNYTAFSNTTSAATWNKNNKGNVVTPLEAPHNDVHLAVGGFDLPGQGESGQISGANGDMGENNTAGLDPIFFFHHCNVDRMFWLWQKQNETTNHFDIIPAYPGTNSSDSQGPTPGIQQGTPLDMLTPLNPFIKGVGKNERVYNSNDCVNIETQLGYTYSLGSLEKLTMEFKKAADSSNQKLAVSGINRSLYSGSFTISVYATIDGKERYIGTQSILNRWNVANCANCQTHLDVEVYFDLSGLSNEEVAKSTFKVDIKGRQEVLSKSALSHEIKVID